MNPATAIPAANLHSDPYAVTDPTALELAHFIAEFLNVPVQSILADVAARKRRDARRAAAQNARYNEALLNITLPQAKETFERSISVRPEF